MKKTLRYGFKALNLAWQANGFYSILAIFSSLYESTLFPLIQVLLLSKLLDLLVQVKNLTFSDISWLIVVYVLASLVKFI